MSVSIGRSPTGEGPTIDDSITATPSLNQTSSISTPEPETYSPMLETRSCETTPPWRKCTPSISTPSSNGPSVMSRPSMVFSRSLNMSNSEPE